MTLNLRQLLAFVAVFEEGSFNKAARRENATQSGLSTLVANLEAQIGLRVFERTTKGVSPTQAGERLYRRSAAIIRDLGEAESELRMLTGDVAGRVRIGLIPAVTYSYLARALAEFCMAYPSVDVTIVEAFSPALTEGVAHNEFDFAIVPAERVNRRHRSSFFGRDKEILVSGAGSPFPDCRSVHLEALPPLRLVLPTKGNARRERLERYFAENGVRIDRIVEMDAMLATLQVVARSSFLTIVPSIFTRGALQDDVHKVHHIVAPEIMVDYAVIEPRGRTMSLPAKLFLDSLRAIFDADGDAAPAATAIS